MGESGAGGLAVRRRPYATVRTSGLATSSVRPALGTLVAAGLVERVEGAYRQVRS